MYSSVQNTCTQSERQATLENLFPGIGVATCHCSAKTVQFHAVVGLALCDCSFWIKMEDIEYLRIQPEEEQEALDFFYSVFVADEGQLSSMGAGRHPEVTEDMLRMLRQGVSLAARDVTSGKMVGQLIMEIFSRKECMSWDKDPPSYSTMLDKYGDEPWARFGHVGGKILWPRDLFTDSPSLETIMDLGFLSVERKRDCRGAYEARRGPGQGGEVSGDSGDCFYHGNSSHYQEA